MSPNREKKIGSHHIEEFYWAGRMVVYVDNRKTEQSFETACETIEQALERSK
jgi:hypothetical protein